AMGGREEGTGCGKGDQGTDGYQADRTGAGAAPRRPGAGGADPLRGTAGTGGEPAGGGEGAGRATEPRRCPGERGGGRRADRGGCGRVEGAPGAAAGGG